MSNFTIHHLQTLKQTATIWPPAINQVECHPYYPQNDLLEYCNSKHIIVQSYAALGGQDGMKAKWKALGGNLLELVSIATIASRVSLPGGKLLLPRSYYGGPYKEIAP